MGVEKLISQELISRSIKNFKKRADEIRDCQAKGHPDAKCDHMYSFHGRIITHMICPTCGGYERNPTRIEYDDFMRNINEPFTF